MATKLESDYPSSSRNDDSDGEAQDSVDSSYQEDEETDKKPSNEDVANILKRLQTSGALIKVPKKEYRCFTCDEDFPDWEELENHLIQHVSLPSVVLDKLPSDDEEPPHSGDDNWTDEEDEIPSPPKAAPIKSAQKIDISQILKKTGLSFKKPNETENNSDSALSKLSGLGFTIKKNSTPIKTEPEESQKNNDVMQKLGKLGGIKLKLKSDGSNTNTFKVVNGLKDFKASDDEDEASENEDSREDQDAEFDEDREPEASGGEPDSADEQNIKNPDSDEEQSSAINQKITNALKNMQAKVIKPKIEPGINTGKPFTIAKSPIKEIPPQVVPKEAKPVGRPAIKQTPKRGMNRPMMTREISQQIKEMPAPTMPKSRESTPVVTPERRQSHDTTVQPNVVVKQEVDTNSETNSSIPLFTGQIKSERTSPPPQQLPPTVTEVASTPIVARVKSDPDAPPVTQSHLSYYNQSNANNTPLLPVAKKEDTGMTIIEINGDSNDEDDDCCVVSATPAPDVKPIIPKAEINPPPSYPPPAYPSTPSSYSSSSRLPSMPSTEKQHNFNWNAPDSKPPIDMLEKSADDIFESLLSSATKKESHSLSDASEYISLDTLGPQHSCDICNTRFTDISLLEEHQRMTGHSKTLVAPSSSTLMPYSSSSNILSSLLPVKQLAEQVGKLSGMGGAPGFTHQQNVMINIQAYPGASGVMPPHPQYNSYPSGPSGFPPTSNNMYAPPGQSMPGQYPSQNYMNQQGYGQFQAPMPKPGYPGTMPPTSYSATSSPYSTASPLQGMQQAVYGQTPTSMQPPVMAMGPPGSSPGHPYVPASSPGGTMKPPNSSGVRIQNVQTFPPGQMMGGIGQTIAPGPQMPGPETAPGQVVGGQMPSPSQIRMAPNANVTGPRPRMPGVRGARPSIRPGIQVHGQVRGAKPGTRMPMKRPGGMVPGPGQKRRPDMLLPGKHDNEDCQVMSMQKQREGLPMIHSVQGAKDKLNLGSQISITKKTVNKEASAMANVLASRGISVKQKQKSRSPTPERPVPHIPNLGAGMSIKHTSKSSNFSIPEAKVGGGMLSCKICKKMFMNYNSLQVHMTNAHPQSKFPTFKCDECPASYPKSLQLQHHKRVFHNASGPNRELGLPVVDLSQEDNLKRLSSLGIYSFIPLANREQASGCFGIPVISVHNMQNGMTTSLQALGADGLLSLGPLKPLPNS